MASQSSSEPEDAKGVGCFHILRVAPSGIYQTIALKRCYRTRGTATVTSRRGLTGDRSRDGDHLDPHSAENRLVVVQCDPAVCPCTKWPGGCNAAAVAEKPRQRKLRCEVCGKFRRNAVETTDPRDEVPRILCNRCSERFTHKLAFKGRQALLRRRHADDAVMSMVAELA